MCEPTCGTTLKEGDLWKSLPRGRHRSVGPKSQFEKRFFRLSDDKLEYWKKNKSKGSFEMKDVKVIEEVSSDVFGRNHCFQIGNEEEYMYIAAPSQEVMYDWMEALQQVAQRRGNQMLPSYHPGYEHQRKWTCCGKAREEVGCTSTGIPPAHKGHVPSQYEQDQLTDSSCSTLIGTTVLNESASILKANSYSFASDYSVHQSEDNAMTAVSPLEEDCTHERRRDSGCWRSRTSSIDSSVGKKSEASGSQYSIIKPGDSSRWSSVESGIENPHQASPETNDAEKKGCTQFKEKYHQERKDLSEDVKNVNDKSDGSNSRAEECEALFKTCRKLSQHPITAVALLTHHIVVYATGDHHVCIYNMVKSRLLYDVKLTHPVSMLDTWNDYILVGSSPVQLFEMKTDRLRRIVVMDSENSSQPIKAVENGSSHLGAFMPAGHFATATGNEIVFWPPPSEQSSIITEAAARLTVGNSSEHIISMWGSESSEQPHIAIARKDLGQAANAYAIDMFDCKDYTHIKAVELSSLELMHLSFERHGRKEIETKYGSLVTATGRSQSSKVCMPVALSDGKIILYEDIGTFSECISKECSKVSSLVCTEANGSPLVVAGYENGKLSLWGGKLEVKPEPGLMEDILTTQVYLGDSFYRESLLRDYYEFTVDFNGGKFENYPSYSLEIPRGAVPKGEEVVIRTGIVKYGPCGQFECPDNIDIVSPVIWLCSNSSKFQFLKPAMLEMQHCCSTPESLVLLKADHDNMKDTHGVFKFHVQATSKKCTSSEYYNSTGITHFCLYCYGIYRNDDSVQQGFRLIPVERAGYMDKTHEVTFCLAYNLNSCQQAVKEQYPSNNYKIKQPLPVQFHGDIGIDIEYPRESSGWLIAQKYPGHPIQLEDLNWEQKFPTEPALVLAHKKKEYPPRFILEFCGKDAQRSVTITVSLTNVKRPVSYEVNLYMPCELEEGQEEVRVCPCSHLLSNNIGSGDERVSPRPFFYGFASNVG